MNAALNFRLLKLLADDDLSYVNYIDNVLWQTEPGSVINDPVRFVLKSRETATVSTHSFITQFHSFCLVKVSKCFIWYGYP